MKKEIIIKKSKEKKSGKKDLLQKMAEKLENLELKLKEKEEKIELIDKNQKNSDIGSQRFGMSDWKSWISGSDKGYHRAMYVDIRSMIAPRDM
jgi:hypothetical protein